MSEEELIETFRRLETEAYDYEEALRDNNITQQDVDKIKEMLKESSEYVPKATVKKQILPILVTLNNNREASYKLMQSYYKLKKETPEFFANRDVNADDIQFAFENQHFAVLPPTPKCCNLVYHKLANSEPKNYVFDAAEKVFLMTVGKIKDNIDKVQQSNGILYYLKNRVSITMARRTDSYFSLT